jgi:hypothetical protein
MHTINRVEKERESGTTVVNHHGSLTDDQIALGFFVEKKYSF